MDLDKFTKFENLKLAAEVSPLSSFTEESSKEKREWFILFDDRYHGPIAVSELRRFQESGLVNGATFVWREDFPDWVELKNVSELNQAPEVKSVEEVTFQSTISPSSEVRAWSANLDELKGIDFVAESEVESELERNLQNLSHQNLQGKETSPPTAGQFIEEIKSRAAEKGWRPDLVASSSQSQEKPPESHLGKSWTSIFGTLFSNFRNKTLSK